MDQNDFPRLVYLVILGSVIAAYFFMANRHRLGQMAQQAMIWGLIFLGVIAAYGLWGDIRDEVVPRQTYAVEDGRIEVPRSPDGHYYLTLDINDAPVRFVVDTGATAMVLTRQDAARVGIDPANLAFVGRANTANGVVSTAPVSLDRVTLGPITDRNVRAQVNGGEMRESLLGMRYLSLWDSLEIRDSRLILTR